MPKVYAPLQLVILLALMDSCFANDNGRALRPVMGWRSWEYVNDKITGKEMNDTIDAIAMQRKLPGVTASLLELGYTDVAIDDGWQPLNKCHRVPGSINSGFHTAKGVPIVDTSRFPGGLSAMARRTKLHPPMTFGWYTNNCDCSEHGYTDATEIKTHYEGDVNATVDWGMGSVKVDGCGQFNNMTLYARLYNETGQAVLIESCHGTSGCTPDGSGGFEPDSNGICPYFKEDRTLVCPFHYFRTSADISFSWDSFMGNLQTLVKFENISRPGCWAHPDMLEVGNLWNVAEDRANFAAWSIASAPLILSFNLTDQALMERAIPTITNREVIEVNQDWAGHPGRLVESHKSKKVLEYLWAVPCDSPQATTQLGWRLQPVKSDKAHQDIYQVVAPDGRSCVDLKVQAPLSLQPCDANPDPSSSSQALVYDEVSGHLGRAHPMQDGTMFGYVNINGGDKPNVGDEPVQFTYSYGPNQPNEEYAFVNGTFRDRCSDGTQAHAHCPVRCVISNTSLPKVSNNAENLVQDIGWQLWQKPLSGGAVAVLVLNRDVDQLAVKLNFANLGVDPAKATGGVRVRDLHRKEDLAVVTDGEYTTAAVGSHDSVMLKLTPLTGLANAFV